eukprot:6982776-Alexandrium_andersonii.AAC.1
MAGAVLLASLLHADVQKLAGAALVAGVRNAVERCSRPALLRDRARERLSLIHISEPTRLALI